jgi:DNA uptake protein ComE-like DNA-binding protein
MHTGIPRTAALALALAALALPPVAAAARPAAASAPGSPASAAPAAVRPIDINSATKAQLKTLPGIGDAEAERIVARRPYRSKADLVTAEVIPAGTYVSIKHRIIALQKRASGAAPTRKASAP